MVWIQRPAGSVVRETRPLAGVVTFGALVVGVAVIADSVNFFLGLSRAGWTLQVVTITTVLFTMAIHAAKTKQVDVLFVLERDRRPLLVGRIVYFLGRNGNYRMRSPDDVGRIRGL